MMRTVGPNLGQNFSTVVSWLFKNGSGAGPVRFQIGSLGLVAINLFVGVGRCLRMSILFVFATWVYDFHKLLYVFIRCL